MCALRPRSAPLGRSPMVENLISRQPKFHQFHLYPTGIFNEQRFMCVHDTDRE